MLNSQGTTNERCFSYTSSDGSVGEVCQNFSCNTLSGSNGPKSILIAEFGNLFIYSSNHFFEIKGGKWFLVINDKLFNSLSWVARMEWQWLGSPGQTNTNRTSNRCMALMVCLFCLAHACSWELILMMPFKDVIMFGWSYGQDMWHVKA